MKKINKIAILGYGVEGKATLDYLFNNGYYELTICDQNVDLKDELPDGVSAHLGKRYLEDLDQFDVIFRSPGIKYFDPLIQKAKLKGTEITSGTKFFLENCPCPVIGVTGTKGKGTCASLIYEMLKKSEKDVFLGGNIGEPPLKFLDKLNADNLVVLELSSFQLQDFEKSPEVAVILNTTEDHLDYHADKDEYLEAKERVLSHQKKNDLAILNKDYEYSKYYKPLVKGDLKWISVKKKIKDGAFCYKGKIYLTKNGEEKEICKTSDIALIGTHNLENILPAILVADNFEVKISDIAKVIRDFKNLPYRLEFIRELKGVKYYNDSFSTTPSTSISAVESFKEPLILIAGGYDKGANYDDWAEKILLCENLQIVILMGDTTEKMEKSLIKAEKKIMGNNILGKNGGDYEPIKILRRENMEYAVVDAYAESGENAVVVLSPAAASFGLFKNYKERGNEFISCVKKLT